jgi:hypothetical protein
LTGTRAVDCTFEKPIMNRRKLILTLVLVALATTCVGWFTLRNGGPWPDAYSRIELGMTRVEVHAAMGMPPGYYEGEWPRPLSMARFVRRPAQTDGIPYEDLSGVQIRNAEMWHGRDYTIWVVVNNDGVAVGKYLLELHPDFGWEPPSIFFDRVLRWLGM